MLVLRKSEHLIWYDQPPPNRAAAIPFFKAFFMLMWTVFAAVVTVFAYREFSTQDEPGIVYLILLLGAGFSVFGLVVLAWNSWQFISGWHTFYGLSNERLLIVRTLWPGQVISLTPDWFRTMQTSASDEVLVVKGRDKRSGRLESHTLYVHDRAQLVADEIKKTLL